MVNGDTRSAATNEGHTGGLEDTGTKADLVPWSCNFAGACGGTSLETDARLRPHALLRVVDLGHIQRTLALESLLPGGARETGGGVSTTNRGLPAVQRWGGSGGRSPL